MTTTFRDQAQQTAGYLVDLLEGVAEEWHSEFQRFVETGEAEDAFLSYLNEDKRAQQAVESAFNRQAAGFEDLAVELKKASLPNAPQTEPLPTPSSISSRVAAVVEAALQTPSARRNKVVETSTAELAASMPAKERDVLKEVVRSLDNNLAKVIGT